MSYKLSYVVVLTTLLFGVVLSSEFFETDADLGRLQRNLLQTSEEKESTEPPTIKEETTKAPKKTGIFVEDEYLLGKLL